MRRLAPASIKAEAAAMHDPKGRQLAFNAETRDRWDAFAGHRAKVTGLLAAGEDHPGHPRPVVPGDGPGMQDGGLCWERTAHQIGSLFSELHRRQRSWTLFTVLAPP
jgi:hypothetical protein